VVKITEMLSISRMKKLQTNLQQLIYAMQTGIVHYAAEIAGVDFLTTRLYCSKILSVASLIFDFSYLKA